MRIMPFMKRKKGVQFAGIGLDTGGGGGGSYELPPATANTLGGVKVGSGLSVTSDGTLSASGGTDWLTTETVVGTYKGKTLYGRIFDFTIKNGDFKKISVLPKSLFEYMEIVGGTVYAYNKFPVNYNDGSSKFNVRIDFGDNQDIVLYVTASSISNTDVNASVRIVYTKKEV